jgi:hypothetical protein
MRFHKANKILRAILAIGIHNDHSFRFFLFRKYGKDQLQWLADGRYFVGGQLFPRT